MKRKAIKSRLLLATGVLLGLIIGLGAFMLLVGVSINGNVRHLDAGVIRYYIRLPRRYYGIGDHNQVQITAASQSGNDEIVAMFADDLAIDHDIIFFHDTGMDLSADSGLTGYYAALDTSNAKINVFKTKNRLYQSFPTAAVAQWRRPQQLEWYGFLWQVK